MRILVLTIYSELSLYTCVLNFSVSSTFKFPPAEVELKAPVLHEEAPEGSPGGLEERRCSSAPAWRGQHSQTLFHSLLGH